MSTTSAFVQQRSKIKPEAFKDIMAGFTEKITRQSIQLRLLAVDGSDIQIATNPYGEDTYFQGANGQILFSPAFFKQFIKRSPADSEFRGYRCLGTLPTHISSIIFLNIRHADCFSSFIFSFTLCDCDALTLSFKNHRTLEFGNGSHHRHL